MGEKPESFEDWRKQLEAADQAEVYDKLCLAMRKATGYDPFELAEMDPDKIRELTVGDKSFLEWLEEDPQLWEAWVTWFAAMGREYIEQLMEKYKRFEEWREQLERPTK